MEWEHNTVILEYIKDFQEESQQQGTQCSGRVVLADLGSVAVAFKYPEVVSRQA